MSVALVTAQKAVKALLPVDATNIFIACSTHPEHASAAQMIAGIAADKGKNVFIVPHHIPPAALSFYARTAESSAALCVGEFGEDGFLLTDEKGVFIKKNTTAKSRVKANPSLLSIDDKDNPSINKGLYEKYLSCGKIIRASDTGYTEYISSCVGKDSVPLKRQKRVVYSALNGNTFMALPHALSLAGVKEIIPIKGEGFPSRCERVGVSSAKGLYASMESQFASAIKMGGEIFVACSPDGMTFAVAVKKYGKFTAILPDELEEMLVDYAKNNNGSSSLSRCALAAGSNSINGVLMPIATRNDFTLSQQMHDRFGMNDETGFLIAKSGQAQWIVRKEMRIADAVSVAVDTVRILLG